MKRYADESGNSMVPDMNGSWVEYTEVVEARAQIKKVLEDAGPMENRDATIRQIMEILK